MLCYSYMRIAWVALDAEQFADIKAGERHLLTLISYEKLSVKWKKDRKIIHDKNIREQVKNIGPGNSGGKKFILQL